MTASPLPAALRAGVGGLCALKAATGPIIACPSWLAREDFACFIPVGTSMAGEEPQEAGTSNAC